MFRASILILLILAGFTSISLAQEMVNPEIKLFGGIYDIPEATVKPLKDLDYKIIIDLNSGSESPEKLNPALNNVARMINLHVIGSASAENI